MAITCTTVNGSINLNDGANYFLIGFDWENTRRQTWLEPRGSTHDLLAMDDPGRMAIHVTLAVIASSQAILITKMENIRNEFMADNVIIWGIGGGSGTTRFQTRPSVISPPSYTNSGDKALLAQMASLFQVPLWQFDLVADPYRANETRQPVI